MELRISKNLQYESSPEKFSEEWLKKQIIIQRDGGDKFIVESIRDQEAGSFHKKIVSLKSIESKHTITKEFDGLIIDLKTLNSPWTTEK